MHGYPACLHFRSSKKNIPNTTKMAIQDYTIEEASIQRGSRSHNIDDNTSTREPFICLPTCRCAYILFPRSHIEHHPSQTRLIPTTNSLYICCNSKIIQRSPAGITSPSQLTPFSSPRPSPNPSLYPGRPLNTQTNSASAAASPQAPRYTIPHRPLLRISPGRPAWRAWCR